MFLPTKYRITIETANLLVLEEHMVKLFAGCALFIMFGLLFTLLGMSPPNPGQDKVVLVLFNIGGPVLLVLGSIPLVCPGRIEVDQSKASVLYRGGMRRWICRPLIISFSQVSHITIKETFSGERSLGNFEKIILERRGKSGVVIDVSKNRTYVNELSRKLADRLGCRVYHTTL